MSDVPPDLHLHPGRSWLLWHVCRGWLLAAHSETAQEERWSWWRRWWKGWLHTQEEQGGGGSWRWKSRSAWHQGWLVTWPVCWIFAHLLVPWTGREYPGLLRHCYIKINHSFGLFCCCHFCHGSTVYGRTRRSVWVIEKERQRERQRQSQREDAEGYDLIHLARERDAGEKAEDMRKVLKAERKKNFKKL